MNTVRRIYAYLLAFAGLTMVSFAAARLAQLVLEILVQKPLSDAPGYVRDTVSLSGAAALVGLPVWLLHWLWIDRLARADPLERASTLRRVYLYAVLTGATLVTAVSSAELLRVLFSAAAGSAAAERLVDRLVEPLPFAAAGIAVWLLHWRIAATDRRAGVEERGSATIRRWYLYGAAFVGLLVLVTGVQDMLETLWRAATTVQADSRLGLALAGPAASTLVGLGVWLLHWAVLPARLTDAARRADGVAVLRSVYLFLGLAVGVVGTLLGASQLLYYAVGRLLGVERPGGVSGDILQAAAGPATAVIVYGITWAYQRQALRAQMHAFAEAPRQAGIRRLYAYLIALASLAVLATGVGGLLWVLTDVLLGGRLDPDEVALFATMAIVGLPVWIWHWRPVPEAAAEAHSLARRLYVYLTLIAASLTLVAGIATVVYRLLTMVLGAPWSREVQSDLAHALAIAVVASLVAGYHWRILRADARRLEPPPVATEATETAAPTHAVVDIRAADPEALASALAALRGTGVEVTVR